MSDTFNAANWMQPFLFRCKLLNSWLKHTAFSPGGKTSGVCLHVLLNTALITGSPPPASTRPRGRALRRCRCNCSAESFTSGFSQLVSLCSFMCLDICFSFLLGWQNRETRLLLYFPRLNLKSLALEYERRHLPRHWPCHCDVTAHTNPCRYFF